MMNVVGRFPAFLLNVLVGVLSVVFLVYHSIKPKKLDKDLPTLDKKHYHPLLGHILYMRKYLDRWPTQITLLTKRFKNKTWGIAMPSVPFFPPCIIFVTDPDNLRHILSDNFENYVKGKQFSNWFRDLLGEGIFVADGLRWKVHRKIMSSMFSKNLMRYSADIMRQKLYELIQTFEDMLDTSKDLDVTIDFQDLMLRLLFDVTSKFAFGVDLDTVSKNAEDCQHPFFTAFDKISYHFSRRGSDVFFPIKRILGIGSEKTIAESIRTIDDFAMNLITERRSNMGRGDQDDGRKSFDLVSKYIDFARKEKKDISDRDLRDIVVSVMFAGRDTTSYALSWAMFELGRNPDVKQKLIDEVENVCGVGENAEYSFDNMNKLKFTHRVILEVLRLHPTLPLNVRYSVKGDTLPDGTRVPVGAGLSFSYYTIGRSVEIWGSDADVFNPERFLESKEPSSFMFPAFHAGPRICLGKPMAYMNMKLVLSMLLTSGLDFKDQGAGGGHSGEYKYAINLSMKDSFPIKISRRCC